MRAIQVRELPSPDFCEVIAAVCDIGKDEYALGVTRMFCYAQCGEDDSGAPRKVASAPMQAPPTLPFTVFFM